MRNDRRNKRLMSRNDLSNGQQTETEELDDNIDFEERLDEYVSSDGPPTRNNVASGNGARTKLAVPGDEDDEENEVRPSIVGKVLSGIGVAVTAAGRLCKNGWFGTKKGAMSILRPLGTACVRCGRLFRGLGPLSRKLTSLFVWKVDEWDEESPSENSDNKETPRKTLTAAASSQPADNNAKIASPASTSEIDEYEFDEPASSRFGWLKRTGKPAAILAAGLLLFVGGYYGVTKFLASKTEIARNENDSNVVKPPQTETGFEPPMSGSETHFPTPMPNDAPPPLPMIAGFSPPEIQEFPQNTVPLIPPPDFSALQSDMTPPANVPTIFDEVVPLASTPVTPADESTLSISEWPPAGANPVAAPSGISPLVASHDSFGPTVTSPEPLTPILSTLAPSLPFDSLPTGGDLSAPLTTLAPLQPSSDFASMPKTEPLNVINEHDGLPLTFPTSDGPLTPLAASTALPEISDALLAHAPSPPSFQPMPDTMSRVNLAPLPPSPMMTKPAPEIAPNIPTENSTQTQFAPLNNRNVQTPMQEPTPTMPGDPLTTEHSVLSGQMPTTSRRAERFVKPETTSTSEPFPMPKMPDDPESNSMLALLPGTPNQVNTSALTPNRLVLPPSPSPEYATPNPPYLHETQTHTATLLSNAVLPLAVTGEKAVSFQDAVQQELKFSPTETEEYIVQQNDTYMGISEKKYGTNLLYRALATHNRLKGAEWRPVPGTIIEIPPADFLQKQYAELLSRMRRPVQRTDQEIAGIKAQATPYTVREGDTVFTIATNVLRDTARWREILEINAETFSDPRDLRPGMRILLPSAYTSQNQPGIH